MPTSSHTFWVSRTKLPILTTLPTGRPPVVQPIQPRAATTSRILFKTIHPGAPSSDTWRTLIATRAFRSHNASFDGACRGEGTARTDARVFVDASAYRDASPKDDPSFEFRCEIRRSHPERVDVTVEHHGNMYSFCSRELELETTEPITILQDDGCTQECEVIAVEVGGRGSAT